MFEIAEMQHAFAKIMTASQELRCRPGRFTLDEARTILLDLREVQQDCEINITLMRQRIDELSSG